MKSIYIIIILTLGVITLSQAQNNNPVTEFLAETPYPTPIKIEEDDNGDFYFATLFAGISKLNQDQNPLATTRILGSTGQRDNSMAIEGATMFYTEPASSTNTTQRINKVDLNDLSKASVSLYEKEFRNDGSPRFLGLETRGTDLYFWDNCRLFKLDTSNASSVPQLVFTENNIEARCDASNIVGDFLYYIFSSRNSSENRKIKRINLTDLTEDIILDNSSFIPAGSALGIKNNKIYFSSDGNFIGVVDLNVPTALPKVLVDNDKLLLVNGIINNDLYISTFFNETQRNVMKINISTAIASIESGPSDNTVNQSSSITYSVKMDTDIPPFKIGGQEFNTDFGEIKLQIHEVDAGDVLTGEDTANQQLISESNIAEFNNNTSAINFELPAPNTPSKNLNSNRTYRLRLFNTGIGAVYANQFAFELTVNEGAVLSVEDVKVPQESVSIYPNPTSSALVVPFDMDSLSLYNLSGKLMLESTEKRNSIQHLPKGIYLAKINYKNQSKTFKIIKK